ncbi:MAG: DUF488 domain-containing protein [Lachnospiraceae bacterium]|nr:DUF488 domain-containing protein [Lachnospiraceae bacterium]
MNEIYCKRIYDLSDDTDGFRILVDRLWPRGVKKDAAHIDLWAKEIAPSNELRQWFGHAPERFLEFSALYLAELNANAESAPSLDAVKAQLSAGNVTLLFGARDTAHNHAVVLKNWIEEKTSESN